MKVLDLRNLPALPKAERPEPFRRASQTLLDHLSHCHRSAYLYIKLKGGPATHRMIGGSIFHEVAERLTWMMVENEERTVPFDVGRVILAEVMAENPELSVTTEEADGLRAMVYNFCERTVIEPDSVLGVEELIEWEFNGWLIRGKIDLILRYDQYSVEIRDYKTSFAMPTEAEVQNNFQLLTYALMALKGIPAGKFAPLAEATQRFFLSQVFPRYRFDDGLGERSTFRMAEQLVDHEAYLADLLLKLEHAIDTGKWQATPGSNCSKCPASGECPIPAHIRGDQGEITTPEQAAVLAEKNFVLKAQVSNDQKLLKQYVDVHGPLEFGDDQLMGFFAQQARSVKDWDKLEEAIQRAVEYGEDFDLADHVNLRKSTRFAAKKRETVE